MNANTNMSFTISNGGSYYVTAVDIVGKESHPSQAIKEVSNNKKRISKINKAGKVKQTENANSKPNATENTQKNIDNEKTDTSNPVKPVEDPTNSTTIPKEDRNI